MLKGFDTIQENHVQRCESSEFEQTQLSVVSSSERVEGDEMAGIFHSNSETLQTPDSG